MQLHDLKPNTKNKNRKRIGRGGKRGTTAGRGTKGQKAHGGHGIRPALRDAIKKLPKLRGRGVHTNKSVRRKPEVVNLSAINQAFASGEDVTPHTLCAHRVVARRGGRVPSVKILGQGELTKKLSVSHCLTSGSAQKKIEEAGGTVVK